MRKAKGLPAELVLQLQAIVELIDSICPASLGEDFAKVCKDMAHDLAAQRQSPLLRGRARTWAGALAYAIGDLNFLFDPSRRPQMRGADLCALFDISQSAASAKASQIRRALGLVPLDPRYWIPRLVPDNPLVWILSVNGVLMDIRHAPRAAQEEALRKGLIPFLPEPKEAELKPPAPGASSDGTKGAHRPA